jgi:hypothetical protein
MRLYARDAQTLGHFALGEVRAVIQPRGPGAELFVTVVGWRRYGVSHFAP